MSQDNQPVEIVVDQEPEANHGDADSAFGDDDAASSSISLRESIFQYRNENGRTYHHYKDGAYIFPNDDKELERLGTYEPLEILLQLDFPTNRVDLTHSMWLLVTDNKLGVAPPCQPGSTAGRVLDIGTGTGIWALDFGDEHPEAEVIAVDLSPTMPNYVPPNVKFQVTDAEDPWTYSRPFQYIHSRVITSGISDWQKYLKKCYDFLEPGGWVEVQEIDLYPTSDDGTLRPDSALQTWANLLAEASVILGRPFPDVASLKQVMMEAGFVDVQMTRTKWPINPWPRDYKWKEIGIWNSENLRTGIEGFSMAALTRGHKWSRDQVDLFLVQVRRDIKDRMIHGYWPIYFITGRKPGREEFTLPRPALSEAVSWP